MNTYDLYDLIEVLCEDELNSVPLELRDDIGESYLESLLYDKFNINFEDFSELIEALLPLCRRQRSEITNTLYSGFGTDNMWLVKKEV